jgi:hypothetical protein
LAGNTSGSITISSPAVSGTNTLTLPASTGTVVVTSGAQTIEFADGSASTPSITNSGDTNTGMFFPAADTIAFAEGGAEAMRLDSSGNVGIGTTSPVTSYRLSIYDQTNGATNISGLALIEPGSATSYSYFKTTSQASADTRTIIGNGAASRAFAFETGGTERMRIDSSGRLMLGTTTTSISSLDAKYFDAADGQRLFSARGSTAAREHIIFLNPNGDVGSIDTTSSSTAYNTSSDYRLKQNIAPMTGALAKVALLKPVTYTWKVDGSDGEGFIAHELQEVKPDCVTGTKDEVDADGNPKYQGVDTSFLVATLTAAIQEQQAIIETLKSDIAELKAKVNV